jgi:hypothetical protein
MWWFKPVILATWEDCGSRMEAIPERKKERKKICKIPSHPIKSWAWWCPPS